DANCYQGVMQTVKLLEELGHTVEEKCPDFSELIEPFQIVWQANVAASQVPVEILQPLNRWLLARNVDAGEYLRAVYQMQMVARKIVTFFDSIDVLVMPVYLHSPIRVGEWSGLSPEETFENIIRWIAPNPAANATGQPSISLPVGFDEKGLPIAVQLMGKPTAENTIISLAAQLEAANPMYEKCPNSYQ
ncbi:MAG: amidase family protein, partial [Cyanobacteria bacterium J06649_11]